MNVGKTMKTAGMGLIFFLMVISFAFFGMDRTLFQAGGKNTVVSAGSRHIESAEYKREFELARDQQAQQSGQQITNEQLVAQGADIVMMNQLGIREAVAVILGKLNVRAGVNMISARLRDIGQFFDPVTGQFDRDGYRAALAEMGTTPQKFEASIGDQIAMDHMYSALTAGVRAPTTISAFQAMFTSQNRDVDVAYVTPAMVGEIPMPTDAQLTTLMNQVAEQVRRPELRVMTIARFSVADVLPTVTVDEAEMQTLFEFRRDQGSTPETRTLVQIPAKDQATAQTIAARLAKGDDPQAIATAVGATVIRQDNKPKTALPDPKVADAAFALKAGETSGPIQGELGISVVKVLAITPGVTPNMEQMRSQIEQEARQRAAEQQISEETDKYDAARQAGTSMADAAKASGAKVSVTPQTAVNGANATGAQTPGLSQRVLQEAFQLGAGEESDLINEALGEYFVVRVDEVVPPRMPALSEVREALTERWLADELTRRLDAKSAELLAKAKTDGLVAAARAMGAQTERINALTLAAAQTQVPKYGEPLLRNVFESKQGEFFSGRAPAAPGQSGPQVRGFVAVVSGIHAGEMAGMARTTQASAPQVTQLLAQELESQVVRAAQQLVVIKTYPDRARLALGIDPATAPAPIAATAEAK